MPFRNLFLGGPTVLENGLLLSAANGVNLGFTELEIKRLRWTIPFAALTMCGFSLADDRQGQAALKLLNMTFDVWLKSRAHITVRLGDYVVAPMELQYLQSERKVNGGFFSGIGNQQIDQMLLSAHVAPYRIDGMKLILDRYGYWAPSPFPNQSLEYERASLVAHSVACLVFGREPEESSLQQSFLVDVVGETQKQITAICLKIGLT